MGYKNFDSGYEQGCETQRCNPMSSAYYEGVPQRPRRNCGFRRGSRNPDRGRHCKNLIRLVEVLLGGAIARRDRPNQRSAGLTKPGWLTDSAAIAGRHLESLRCEIAHRYAGFRAVYFG